MDLKAARKKVDGLLARHALAKATVVRERDNLHQCQARLNAAREAQEILQEVAQEIQQQAHENIAGVVTRCLKAVFGKTAPSFRINFVRKRGRTEAELVFVKGGQEIDPQEASGGGSVDVAALALRLVSLTLTRPPLRRLLVMDEPGKWVNGEVYQERFADLLLQLAQEFHIQMVISTDDDFLKIGKVIELD